MTQFTITELSRSYNSYGKVSALQISRDRVVWTAYDSTDKKQIFLYNGEETIQLTNNNELSEIDPRIVVNLKIDGNRVVWGRHNMIDSTKSIMLATIDDTESSSTQNRDRNPKIITSSTIIILGLVFLYLLKRTIGRMSND